MYIPFQRFIQMIIQFCIEQHEGDRFPLQDDDPVYTVFELKKIYKKQGATTRPRMPIPDKLLNYAVKNDWQDLPQEQ